MLGQFLVLCVRPCTPECWKFERCSVGGCKLIGISYEQDVELRGASDMQSFFENQRVFQCLKITFVWFSL